MTERFLIYSPRRGIHLGGGVWSKDPEATTKAFAPTYLWEISLDQFVDPLDVILAPVVPDLPGHHVSKAAVVAAGHKGW